MMTIIKFFLKVFLLITLMCVLELLAACFKTWELFYSINCKFYVSLFITTLLWEKIGGKILNRKIDPKKKAVFITGCDSGFGFHTAKLLDSKGYSVFAGCLFPTRGGASELKETCSERLRTLQVNVTQNDSVLKAKDYVQENLGDNELWAVVNNAGILRVNNAEICPLEDYQELFDVNVMGHVRVSKAFLPLLRQSKGRLVNINSRGGRLNWTEMTAYCMSKYASVCFTECLQVDMNQFGVQVISIEPELFRTSLAGNEHFQKHQEDVLNNLDDELKSTYGEKYLKFSRKFQRIFFNNASPDIEKVIDAIETAITAANPEPVYKVCRNWYYQLGFYYVEWFPDIWKYCQIYKLF